MTLQEFRKHLQEIDKAAGANFFDNNVKRQNDREFTYDFDGHMDCQLIINKAGSVTELCEEYTRNFSSFGSWKQAMIEEFSRWHADTSSTSRRNALSRRAHRHVTPFAASCVNCMKKRATQ